MRKCSKFLVLFLSLLCLGAELHAQKAITISDMLQNDRHNYVPDIAKINETVVISDTLVGWDYNWVSSLNGSQAAYSNWSQGGVNTISVTASTVYSALYRHDKFGYGLSTNFKYGKARIANEGMRKTDDRIAVNNKFSYLLSDEHWSAFANVNFSSQFDQGFDYDVADGEDPILISKFFSPAYFTQIAGIGYTPSDYFTAEAGLALKETFVLEDSLSTRYGLTAGDNFRFEPGYSFQFGFEKEIVKNLKLVSSLETFTNLRRSINRTDVAFSNELIGKINDFLNMSFQFVSIYDDDFNSKLQVKQVLSAGISVSIL